MMTHGGYRCAGACVGGYVARMAASLPTAPHPLVAVSYGLFRLWGRWIMAKTRLFY